MSATASATSLEFMRSVTSLTQDDGIAPQLDTVAIISDAPKTAVTSLLPQTPAPRMSRRISVSPDTTYMFVPYRVYVNGVDTFNGKHISRILSLHEYGSLKPSDGEEESEYGAEELHYLDFLFSKDKNKSNSKVNYHVVGSLLNPDSEYDRENIHIVDHTNNDTFFKRLASCGFIIYDITQHASQIEHARAVLNFLLDEIEKLEKHSAHGVDHTDVPKFILISTYMTWALTKPVDPEEPGIPFQEMDYRSRKCHPNFKNHYDLENEVVAAGKAFPHRFKTLVICSGIVYGFEEETLNFLFKMAWENEPALPLFEEGRNFVPLIHIRDLGSIIFNVLELFPNKHRYTLAVEQTISSTRAITRAISSILSTGETFKAPKEEMIMYKVNQHVFDCLTVNVRMESAFFLEMEHIIWTEPSFVENIEAIVQEYRISRHLEPIRILITGPPACGKTIVAKRLCEYYQLHYISEESITEISIRKLREKIERLKAKEAAAAKKEIDKHIENALDKEYRDEIWDDDVEEEELEEEWLDEVEEERDEPISKLQAMLDRLMQNAEENDGKLDEEMLLNNAKEIIVSPPLLNQGFVLDGFPSTVEQMKTVFENHDFNSIDEEESRCLDYNIVLVASDDYIIERFSQMPEEELQKKNYKEEVLMKRLFDYRNENPEVGGIMRFLADHEIETLVVPVEEDLSPMLAQTYFGLRESIGPPRNFGATPEEVLEELREVEDEKKWLEAQDLAKKQEVEKQLHTERVNRLENWARSMDALIEEEEDALASATGDIRHYLTKYIFPTLTRGLLEVAQRRPEDPIDFLAEYLFKNNPDGKVLRPADTRQYRKLFDTIRKDIERLYGKTEEEKGEDAASGPSTTELEAEKKKKDKHKKEINILDLQVGERPAGTIY